MNASSIAMQTPELLLTRLNDALRELRGAARVLDDHGLDAVLLPVMRRLMLAQIMNDSWLVAVGGTQGAGKTTLVRTLYALQDIDSWLPDNQGRGETLPILIEESADLDAPQGYAKALIPVGEDTRQFKLGDKPLDRDEFVKACRGQVPEALLPVLRVPRRYFQHKGQALLLLPGYEPRDKENAVWQDLMRQALVGAAGCVIVTDSTRLADKSQQEVVKDMLANELRTVRPIVVIAKTETMAADSARLEELRKSAAAAFELDGDDAMQRVICAGTDAPGVDYTGTWLPVLGAVLRDMSVSGGASRQSQLARLEYTLAGDLTEALAKIKRQAALFARSVKGDDGAQETLKACLAAFDEANAALRPQHQKMVKDFLGKHYGEAWEKMQDRLESHHEGLLKKIVSTFDSVTQAQRKIERDVRDSWSDPGSVLERYAAGLGKLTARAAAPDLKETILPAPGALQRLGYVDAENKPVPSKFTDPKVQSSLRALLQSEAGKPDPDKNRELEQAAKMLPAMTLEFMRIASALPQLVHVDQLTLEPMPQADLTKSMHKVKQQFSDFSEASRGILKGIATIMAIDVATDGHADIIDALVAAIGAGGAGSAATGASTAATAAAGGATTAAGAAGLTIGGAVAGAVAIGYLVHSALQEVKRHDGQVRALANNMLQNTRDHHLVHFMAHYDELMGLVRSQLRQGLRRRYGLDQRLVEQDRLSKALADVRVLQQDLLSHLSDSGQTLTLFDRVTA